VSRSISNFGSSMGTAVAGAVLVSTLVAGINNLTAQSTVLSSTDKAAISTAMEGSVSAVSDAQVRAALEGKPQAVVDEVVRINSEARTRALALSMATVGVVGLIGLVATFFLPGRRLLKRFQKEDQDPEPEPAT
jgi:hypothetical protein